MNVFAHLFIHMPLFVMKAAEIDKHTNVGNYSEKIEKKPP